MRLRNLSLLHTNSIHENRKKRLQLELRLISPKLIAEHGFVYLLVTWK